MRIGLLDVVFQTIREQGYGLLLPEDSEKGTAQIKAINNNIPSPIPTKKASSQRELTNNDTQRNGKSIS